MFAGGRAPHALLAALGGHRAGTALQVGKTEAVNDNAAINVKIIERSVPDPGVVGVWYRLTTYTRTLRHG